MTLYKMGVKIVSNWNFLLSFQDFSLFKNVLARSVFHPAFHSIGTQGTIAEA